MTSTRFILSALAIPCAAFALLACASPQAQAVGQLADISVVDRDSGATLQVYRSRGEFWVAGRPGARYAVTVRNRLGERLLAVPSVDGVNVLSGETAAWHQSGYVFSAYERYQITGWRKSNSEVAAFEFSAAGDSYAGRTGRPAHVGMIGVALFREKAPAPMPRPLPEKPWRAPHDNAAETGGDNAPRLRGAAPVLPAPAAAAQEQRAEGAASRSSADSFAKSAPQQAGPKLGTAHGRRESSVVGHTSFTRQQNQPDEIISIRYDSRENLVAAGVIREPAGRPPLPRPFPDSSEMSYVPDPPARPY